jgi:tryptophanyl-tRNA synthetase
VVFRCDVGICIEVGEHISQEREHQFAQNLTCNAGLLFVSWALPGQRGRGHINCKTEKQVIDLIGRHGGRYHQPLTKQARQIAGEPWSKKLLVFR